MKLTLYQLECLEALTKLSNDYLKAIDAFECSEDGQHKWEHAIMEMAVELGLGKGAWDRINAAVARREDHDARRRDGQNAVKDI